MSFLLINFNENPDDIFSKFRQEKFPYPNLYSFDKTLGYKHKPNIEFNKVIYTSTTNFSYSMPYTNRIISASNINLFSSVLYTTDAYGRRISPQKTGKKTILLFGCSYIFGEELNNNETINYYLSEITDYEIHNYAVSGYGTQQMLGILDEENFTIEEVNQSVYALYFYIPEHIRRVIGDMQTYNLWG